MINVNVKATQGSSLWEPATETTLRPKGGKKIDAECLDGYVINDYSDVDKALVDTIPTLTTEIDGKVDKVTGYGLSQNDYDDTEKASVATISGKADATHTHVESDITNLSTDLAGKQGTLESGINIKTINGSSILGSGDLEVSSNQFPIGTPSGLPDSGKAFMYPDYVHGNIVPVMTSATTPSGVASASSSYVDFPAYAGFISSTKANYVGWIQNGEGVPAWLQYKFDSATKIYGYKITPWSYDNWGSRSPKTWKMQGSNDGTNYTDIDSRTNFTTWVSETPVTFLFSSAQTYQYYRLYVTANMNSNAYTGVGRLELIGNATAITIKTMDSSGKVFALMGATE